MKAPLETEQDGTGQVGSRDFLVAVHGLTLLGYSLKPLLDTISSSEATSTVSFLPVGTIDLEQDRWEMAGAEAFWNLEERLDRG